MRLSLSLFWGARKNLTSKHLKCSSNEAVVTGEGWERCGKTLGIPYLCLSEKADSVSLKEKFPTDGIVQTILI